MSNEKTYNPKLDDAAHAVTEDDRELVRACLEAVMEQTGDRAEFWLLQAWASESLQGAEDALKRAIVIDPENETAESGLSWIRGIKDFAETQLQEKQQVEQARAEEEARKKAEEEARILAEQERLRAEEEKTRREAEEEARIREEQERLRAEEERARVEAEAKREAEEEARIREEQERLRAEEERARVEAEAKREADEEARVERERERQTSAAEELRLKADEEAPADDRKTADAGHPTATSNDEQSQVASSTAAETKLHETVETLASDVRQQVQTFDNESPDSSRLDAAQPMILAVDDSPTIRKLVTLALAQQGYEVVTAEDGIEALSIIAERMPDLILSDINMPKLGGYKLCSFVKKHDRTKHIPVIMLSGKDGVFDKMRGKMNGCDAFIAKPFESRDLVEIVREHLPRVPSLSNGPIN